MKTTLVSRNSFMSLPTYLNTMNTKLFFTSIVTIGVFVLFVSYEVYRTMPTSEPLIHDAVVSRSLRLHRRHGMLCQNDDFFPENTKSVWTMLTDDTNYVLSALKMGHALRLHTEEPFDMVSMELVSKPLGNTSWSCLKNIGWKRCVVDRIAPLQEGSSRAYRYVDQFTKLHLWGMTMYQTLVYLDADTMVLHSISHLLHCNLGNHSIGVSAQAWYGKFEAFNMGVFVIHPEKREYERLLKLQRDPSMYFDASWAEQGFLNVVYKDKWHDLGFQNNALTWVSWQNHVYWKSQYAHFNVVHFGGLKPWACFPDIFTEWLIAPSMYYLPVCKEWMEMPPKTCAGLI